MPSIEDYQGKRITVTGVFDRYGMTTTSGTTALVHAVELEGEKLLDHAWVQQAENFFQYDMRRGERVQFSAVVLSYKKWLALVRKDGAKYEIRYGLQRPTEIILLERPGEEPRRTANEPSRLFPIQKVTELGPEESPYDEPAKRALPGTGRKRFEKIAKVQSLADELGGYAELQRLLNILKG